MKIQKKVSDFPCTKCGACCIMAGKLNLMPHREDGACIHLQEDNLCAIYDTRPEVCRINVMMEKSGADPDEYHAETKSMCNKLQKDLEIDPSFRV